MLPFIPSSSSKYLLYQYVLVGQQTLLCVEIHHSVSVYTQLSTFLFSIVGHRVMCEGLHMRWTSCSWRLRKTQFKKKVGQHHVICFVGDYIKVTLYIKGHPHLAILPATLLANCCWPIHTKQVSSNTFENCWKYRHPHLAMLPALLRVMLNMFNFPAVLLAISSYLEGEIDYSLAKTELKCYIDLFLSNCILIREWRHV